MKNKLGEKSGDKLSSRNIFFLNFLSNDIKNKTVLDVGCGFGWLEYRLKDKVKHITGIDVNDNDILKAKNEINSKNVEFITGNALKLPFKDNNFDVVISSEVIEHLPKNSEECFLKEISRVLKKEGKLFLTTPFDDTRSKLLDLAWWFIGHRHYSIKDLDKYTKKINFRRVDYKICGGFWSMLGLLNLYISKWIFSRNRFFENYFYKKELNELKKNNGWMNLMVKYQK